jgi:hypothetical protein
LYSGVSGPEIVVSKKQARPCEECLSVTARQLGKLVRDASYLTTKDSLVNTEPYMKSEGYNVEDGSCSVRIDARRPSELVPCCSKQLWLDRLLPV